MLAKLALPLLMSCRMPSRVPWPSPRSGMMEGLIRMWRLDLGLHDLLLTPWCRRS